MQIYNLINKNNKSAANQFVIIDGNITIFQSYNSKICCIDNGNNKIIIGSDWDYSVTTSKHFYTFLSNIFDNILVNKAFINKIIKEGKYKNFTVIYDPAYN